MPLFGKNSDKKISEPQAYGSGGGAGSYSSLQTMTSAYPTQTTAYPTYQQASQYPHQPNPAAPSAPTGPSYGAGPYEYAPNEPPPPYAPPGAMPMPGMAQQRNPYPPPPPAYGSSYPTTGQPPMYQAQPQTVYCAGTLDSGARQGPMSSQMIPPAPPGCPPNQAQMAAMQGHNVVVTQRKENWFTGGTGGGYTWW